MWHWLLQECIIRAGQEESRPSTAAAASRSRWAADLDGGVNLNSRLVALPLQSVAAWPNHRREAAHEYVNGDTITALQNYENQVVCATSSSAFPAAASAAGIRSPGRLAALRNVPQRGSCQGAAGGGSASCCAGQPADAAAAATGNNAGVQYAQLDLAVMAAEASGDDEELDDNEQEVFLSDLALQPTATVAAAAADIDADAGHRPAVYVNVDRETETRRGTLPIFRPSSSRSFEQAVDEEPMSSPRNANCYANVGRPSDNSAVSPRRVGASTVVAAAAAAAGNQPKVTYIQLDLQNSNDNLPAGDRVLSSSTVNSSPSSSTAECSRSSGGASGALQSYATIDFHRTRALNSVFVDNADDSFRKTRHNSHIDMNVTS